MRLIVSAALTCSLCFVVAASKAQGETTPPAPAPVPPVDNAPLPPVDLAAPPPVALEPPPAPAETPEHYDDSEPRTAASELVLGGHLFQLPALQLSPFITTSVGVREGAQFLNVPNSPVVGTTTANVNALGVSTQIDAGLQFWERLQLTFGATATAYSGTAFKSILVGGAGYSYMGNVGLGFKIFRGPTTQLTVRGGFEGGRANRVEFLNLVNAIVQQPPASVDDVVDTNVGRLILSQANRTAESLSLHLAQSLGPVVGIQATASLAHANFDVDFYSQSLARQVSTGLTLWTPEFSLAVDVDLRKLMPRVPIALMGEYTLRPAHVKSDGEVNEWLTASQLAGFGVYYSGRAELTLGLSAFRAFRVDATEGFDSNGHTYPSGRPSYDTVAFTLRYVW